MTRVYAGNLSWSVSDGDLADFMTPAGEVKSAEVIKYPDGRSKGWGLVEFVSPEAALTAITTLSDQLLMDRKIFIREDREVGGELPATGRGGGRGVGTIGEPARGKGGKGRGRGRGRAPMLDEPEDVPTGGTALYVGNLPWSTTWQQLKEIFQEYNVKYADVKMGFDGRSRGYGIVRFDSEEEAYAALALNSYLLEGREILVRFDKQQSLQQAE